MDLPVLSNSGTGFLITICLFVNLQGFESRGKGYDNYGRGSCVSASCTRNRTIFDISSSSGCYCDEACYKTFFDCCPDYEEYCGPQELSEPGISLWKCVELPSVRDSSECVVQGATGVWMISQCPSHWRFKKSRRRCENPTPNFSDRVEAQLPVVGANFLTYRNEYCAFCNGVENFTSWNYKAVSLLYVEPPKEYDLSHKLEFIDYETDGMNVKYILPARGQPQRLCFGSNYSDNCSSTDNVTLYKSCLKGPVEVVTRGSFYFKNIACAECNGLKINTYNQLKYCPLQPKGFTIVFSNLGKANGTSTTSVVTVECPTGAVHDTNFHFCRKMFNISSSGQRTSEYFMAIWFKITPTGGTHKKDGLEYDFKLALMSAFFLERNKISNVRFHSQGQLDLNFHWHPGYLPKCELYVATFHLTLTPFQSLIMANLQKIDFNVKKEETAFLKLFNSKRHFELSWNKTLFFVIKSTSQRLSCHGEVKIQSHKDSRVDQKNRNLVVDKTGKAYSMDDYAIVEENGRSITLCRKLVLWACKEDDCLLLRPNEYEVFLNLSVYHNTTKNIYGLGEYLIYGKNINCGISTTSNMSDSSRNLTIASGLPRNIISNKTVTILTVRYQDVNNTTRRGLKILTLIGFIPSVVLFLLLLVTYGLFRELRTVPGMNLFNLSVPMFLSHLIWLLGTSHFTGTTACKVFAILEHYLFQVSFLAMSVISYHSFLVFSRPFVANTSWRRFVTYSAVVWLTPAIFVAICVVLDETEVFPVDYGTNCWLGSVNAKLYLFLLPLAISLLYNIFTFIKTARLLLCHDETRDILQLQEGKQNLLICTKLASLVGLPWLFAFLGVLFPDEIAFEYLFVVFVSLQGLYIGMAFLFDSKTLNLFKGRLNRVLPFLPNPPIVEMTPASG